MKDHHADPLSPDTARALSRLHYGLYFLTSGSLDRPLGLVVSWVSQLGGLPPMLMAAVRHNRSPLRDILERGAFAVNLLASGDMDLLRLLARPSHERFNSLGLVQGPLGLPLLARAPGFVSCKITQSMQPGDHVLLIGEVQAGGWQGEGKAMSADETGHAYLGLS